MDKESKFSAAVGAEVQTCEWSIEPVVRLAGEYTRRLRVTDAQACVVVAMIGLGTGAGGFLFERSK